MGMFMENNGWIPITERFPKHEEAVLVLDYTNRDIIMDWCIFEQKTPFDIAKWKLVSGGSIIFPQFWRNDIKLPEIVTLYLEKE